MKQVWGQAMGAGDYSPCNSQYSGRQSTINLPTAHLATLFSTFLDLLIVWVFYWLHLLLHAAILTQGLPMHNIYNLNIQQALRSTTIYVYWHLHTEFHFGAFRSLENMTPQWMMQATNHLYKIRFLYLEGHKTHKIHISCWGYVRDYLKTEKKART